jgi:hypothetical protein
MKKKFPPPSLSSLDRDSAGLFIGLLKTMRSQSTVLVLGSGSSAAIGAPTWAKLLILVSEAFFNHLDYARLRKGIPAERISIAFTEAGFTTMKSRALASSLLSQSPLLAAQLIQNCIREADWNYLVRKIIGATTGANTPQRTIAKLCQSSGHVKGVVNFNYDDLFERHLPAFAVDYSACTELNPTPKKGTLPIWHVHGWLPQEGGQDSRIILSEGDYFDQSQTPYSWSNSVQLSAYSCHTAVFIGNSMTDPHLKTLLRATSEVRSFPHYAFLPSRASWSDEDRVVESLFDNDLVGLKTKVIRYPLLRRKRQEHSVLWALIRLLSDAIDDEAALWTT